MKKLFISLFILFLSSVAFADTNFLGIPFDITKSDNAKNGYDSRIESELSSIFLDYCKDVDVDLRFNKSTNKLNYIHLELELKSTIILGYFEAYFADNLHCKKSDKTFYNDEIIAFVDTSGGDELHIDVATRETFNNFLKNITK